MSYSFSSLREGAWAAWMDAQYAAHAAHAVDLSVLDACPTPLFWMASQPT